jgi:hypothetical protein
MANPCDVLDRHIMGREAASLLTPELQIAHYCVGQSCYADDFRLSCQIRCPDTGKRDIKYRKVRIVVSILIS